MDHPTILEKCVISTKIEIFLFKFFRNITACPIIIPQIPSGFKVKVKGSARKWLIFTLIVFFCYIFLMQLSRYIFLPKIGKFGVLSEVFIIGLPFFIFLVILLETQFTLSHFTELLYLKQKTETNLRKLCGREKYEREKYSHLKDYMIILFCYFVFVLILRVITKPSYNKMTLFYSYWTFLPIIFNRFRYFQHQLFTNIIHSYIKLIRMQVENCVKNCKHKEGVDNQDDLQQFVIESKRISNELKSSMQILASVSRMVYLVNRIFGFSLCLLFLQDSVVFLCYLYWISFNLYNHRIAGTPGIIELK